MIRNTEPSSQARGGLSRLAGLVWQHRFLFTACLLLSGLVAAMGYMRAPKRYHSETVVALDVRKLQALPSESVMAPLPQESPVLRTEIDIIGSRSMAERVYANLGLGQPAADINGKNSRFATAVNADGRAKSVDELLDNVRVMNDGRSYTIYISYTARDPVFAATVANAFATAYIDYQIDLQTTATRRVSEWLGERLVSLQKKLEVSEQSAAAFRQKEGLVGVGGTNLQAQQLSGLNTELTTLQARLAEVRARLATATDVLQKGEGVGLTEVLSSPAIQLLRAEQARVVRGIADIDQSGARMNPQRPQLESQLASLKSQIHQEVLEIVSSLRNEIEVNQRQQSEVYRNLQDVQHVMSVASMATVQAAQLEREANANRSIYETYLARYKQMIEQDGIATAEARIITRAMPRAKPASPDKVLWALGALLAGTACGLGAVWLRGLNCRSIGSVATLQQKTGLSVFGRVPRMRPGEIQVGPAMFSGKANDFHCAVAEIRTSIQLAQTTQQGKSQVFALTSSAQGEGKTFIVTHLARSLASSGLKVLVIDANLRDPSIGEAFGVFSAYHLARAVKGNLAFDDVLHRDPLSPVDVIVAERQATPPDFILGAVNFKLLIAEMRTRYDLVLIDCPSCTFELDLARIACMVDAVAFVVDPERADSLVLQAAADRLRAKGDQVLGMVLNGVRRRKPRSRNRAGPVILDPAGSRQMKPGPRSALLAGE
ncbi:polysaccharide biosynthesis protein [Rhizobium sp. Leaf384]|uniref:GumC family protein n=1 Tax=unclassified Rhizobium TaxID=2613769 RepID=UPI00071512B8|nr:MULTISPECIES: polysaccharide biosynthesis tyrosine autokinase [unclassified Rhizobium]KQS76655.1 polysaccharide biosynthesis protein [Rhizobium sp. Leaf383]KQS77923.1 polysaccharide biosynthesis protein [Rhizobium sp. Leaf384]